MPTILIITEDANGNSYGSGYRADVAVMGLADAAHTLGRPRAFEFGSNQVRFAWSDGSASYLEGMCLGELRNLYRVLTAA